jgi:AcrR family transcriptional regulator
MTARSAPAKKRGYHHGDLARALVTAAVDIIDKHGPEAFTLREAAAAIGVTHGAAYRHFEDKQALLAAVAEEGYRALVARLAKAPDTEVDPRARLRSIAAAYVDFAMEKPAHYRVMWGPRLNEDGRFPLLEAAIADGFTLLVAEFERGQASGVFRRDPPRDMAIAFWVTAHGYVELVLRRRIKVKSTKIAVEYFERLLEPFLSGIARPGRGGRDGDEGATAAPEPKVERKRR